MFGGDGFRKVNISTKNEKIADIQVKNKWEHSI